MSNESDERNEWRDIPYPWCMSEEAEERLKRDDYGKWSRMEKEKVRRSLEDWKEGLKPGVKWFNTVFYPKWRKARAAQYEEKILPSLLEHGEIPFFTPWGPRYSWKERGSEIRASDKEIDTLYYLLDILEELRENMREHRFRWEFLGADLYGTRINGLPEEVVARYFKSLQRWISRVFPYIGGTAGSVEVTFKLWSECERDSIYRVEKTRQEIWENFDSYVDANLLERTQRTAEKMGGGDPRTYLVERLTEAKVMGGIKVSCVRRDKDDKVDLDMARLYLLPEDLQAPWL